MYFELFYSVSTIFKLFHCAFKGRVRQSAIGFRKFVNLEAIYENVCISLISEPFSIILDVLESSVSPLSNFRIFRCSNAIVADDYGIIADWG